jgi:hypothetical protein
VIELSLDCLKYGSMALTGAPHGAFDVLLLGSANSGTAVARVEIEHGPAPKLRVVKLDEGERFIDARAAAAIERAILATFRDDAPTHAELSARHCGDDVLEMVLSGDCRHKLFHWRVQFRVVNGEVVVHGPFLANDPDT